MQDIDNAATQTAMERPAYGEVELEEKWLKGAKTVNAEKSPRSPIIDALQKHLQIWYRKGNEDAIEER